MMQLWQYYYSNKVRSVYADLPGYRVSRSGDKVKNVGHVI